MGKSDIANAETEEPTRQKPLRLWPGVVIVVLQWLGRFGVPIIVPEAMQFGVMGGTLRRVGYRRMVGVLQPSASVRALGCCRPDDCRHGRDIAHPPRVDCNRRDGDDIPRLRHPGLEPRLRRLGGGQPQPL